MHKLPEKELVLLARAGEAEAISMLYSNHKEKVYRFLFYRLGSQAEAEDIFQDVMMAAFDSLDRFRGEVPFLHWCYQIARNKIAMFWREKYKVKMVDLDEGSGAEDMDLDPDNQDRFDEQDKVRERVMAVLNQLPDHYAEILKLRFLERKTIKESAEEMGISVNNAKVLQHRALKKAIKLST